MSARPRRASIFDWQINSLENQGVLAGLVDTSKLPLISSYTSVNLTDPAMRAQTMAAAVSVGQILKKYGGKTIVVGPSRARDIGSLHTLMTTGVGTLN